MIWWVVQLDCPNIGLVECWPQQSYWSAAGACDSLRLSATSLSQSLQGAWRGQYMEYQISRTADGLYFRGPPLGQLGPLEGILKKQGDAPVAWLAFFPKPPSVLFFFVPYICTHPIDSLICLVLGAGSLCRKLLLLLLTTYYLLLAAYY